MSPRLAVTPLAGSSRALWLFLSTLACLAVVVGAAVFVPSTNGAFTATVTNAANSAGVKKFFTCTQAIQGTQDAIFGWSLSSKNSADLSGKGNPEASANDTYASGAGNYGCLRDTPQTSMVFNGNPDTATGGLYSTTGWSTQAQTAPAVYTEEVWFKTTSAQGVLMGFASVAKYRNETSYGRAVWINAAGQLMAGNYSSTGPTYTQVTSPKVVTDGQWHNVIVTRDPATGLRIYLDGALAGSVAAGPAPENYSGFFRLGCMQLSNWPNGPTRTTECFKGNMQYASAYSRAFTAAEVLQHYQAGV